MEVDVSIDRLYKYLKSIASLETSANHCCEYSDGALDGEIKFARELLRDFFDEEETSNGS